MRDNKVHNLNINDQQYRFDKQRDYYKGQYDGKIIRKDRWERKLRMTSHTHENLKSKKI